MRETMHIHQENSHIKIISLQDKRKIKGKEVTSKKLIIVT